MRTQTPRTFGLPALLTVLLMMLTACRSPMSNRVYGEEVPIGIRDDFLRDRDAGGAYGYWPETHSVGATYVLLSVGLDERFDSVIRVHAIDYERGSGIIMIVAEEIDVLGITSGGYNPDDWYFLLRFEVFVRDIFVFYPDGSQWGCVLFWHISPICLLLSDPHGLSDPVQGAVRNITGALCALSQQVIQLP